MKIEIPRYKYADTPGRNDTLLQQLEHTQSELQEAKLAIMNGEGRERIIEELLDIIHSSGTALYMMGADEDIEKSNSALCEKNFKRGYYSTKV